MGSNRYWIKVHRKIRESALWESDEPFDRRSAWIDLLLEANVKDHDVFYKGSVIKVKRGDVYTSIRKLAAKWHWSTGKVTRFLKNLAEMGMIRKHENVKNVTLLTIINYGVYQDKRDADGDTDETETRHKRDGDGVLLKNNKNIQNEKKEEKEPSPPEGAGPFLDGFEPMTEEEWESLPDV